MRVLTILAIILLVLNWSFLAICQDTPKEQPEITAEILAAALRTGRVEWYDHIRSSKQRNPPKLPVPHWPMLKFETGRIGSLREETGYPIDLKVLQIIDGHTALVRIFPSGRMLWVEGFATRGLTDDAVIRPTGLFCVSGTRQYESVLGSTRTVLVIKRVEISAEMLEEAKKLARKPVKKRG